MANHSISNEIRRLVINRAKERCEYCLIHQKYSIYSHEIDHIIPMKHGGKTSQENLALSCLSCNRHKGSDFATIDLTNNEIVPLFNPRQQNWSEHFELNNGKIEGLTKIGKGTARLLQFNAKNRLIERQLLIKKNLFKIT